MIRTYGYDPLGRLWQMVKGAANTRFLYDGDALVGEYDGSGNLTNRYVHGSNAAADDPLMWYVGSGLTTKRYLHADHLGSIVGITNCNASAPCIDAYDEYGVPAAANVGRFQYTGQAWLSELGLYHYKSRLYDPHSGRFLQTDPVGYDDAFNLYEYVGDDPINASDWSGQAQDIQSELGNTCSRLGGGSCSGDYLSGKEFAQATAVCSSCHNRVPPPVAGPVNSPMAKPQSPSTSNAAARADTRRPSPYRVTVQIQGSALRGNNIERRNNQGNISQPIERARPVTAQEARNALYGLYQSLEPRDANKAYGAFKDAMEKIGYFESAGGYYGPVPYSIRGTGELSGSELRIDVQINAGQGNLSIP